MQKRQFLPNLLTKNDVGRFRSTTTRFDNILDDTKKPVIRDQVPFVEDDDEDVVMPDGPMGIMNNIKNFFSGSEENEDVEVEEDDTDLVSNIDGSDVSTNFELLSKNSTSLFQESDMLFENEDFLLGDMSGINVFNIGNEDEEENVDQANTTFSPGTAPGSTFISINPDYENIIKIPFVLQYGTPVG